MTQSLVDTFKHIEREGSTWKVKLPKSTLARYHGRGYGVVRVDTKSGGIIKIEGYYVPPAHYHLCEYRPGDGCQDIKGGHRLADFQANMGESGPSWEINRPIEQELGLVVGTPTPNEILVACKLDDGYARWEATED